MRSECPKLVPAAILSRAVVGIPGKTLIVNLPGSPGGARENLAVLLPAIPHAIEKIRGEGGDCVPQVG
jgi:molybdopterin biosynthesis enzyme MoaB